MLAVLMLCSGFYIQGQNVSLNFQNAPIEKVFEEIKRQTGYSFVYTRNQVRNTTPLTIRLNQVPLKFALDICFANQPISYVLEEKHVVIQDKAAIKNEDAREEPVKNEILGRVVDNAGVPIGGVTVSLKGTGTSTVSDVHGGFKLVNIPEKGILVFTHVSYNSEEIVTGTNSNIIVRLSPFISDLDETVVMAYGITTKRYNTGNIGKITADQISSQPVMNPLAAMQGRIPGVVITQTSGVPGAAFKVEIRGRTAIDLNISKNDPLYIIDGVPFDMGSTATNLLSSAANNPTSISEGGLSALNLINPQDIESIEVLKDADATAIYGSRGANGVILITTKAGTSKRTTINLRLNTGFSRVTRLMEMMNTQQYVEMRREAFLNDGVVPTINNAPDILLWDTTRHTDIQKLLVGGTAKYTDAQVSISGGNKLTSFLLGASFHKETTVLPGDFSSKRVTVNSNINHTTVNNRFSLNFNTIYSNADNQLPSYDPSQYFRVPPNLMLYDSAGKLAWQEKGVSFASVNNHINPLAPLNEKYYAKNDNLSANLNLKLKLLNGLFLKSSMGYNLFTNDESSQKPWSSIDPASTLLPSAMFANSVSKSWIIEPQLEYLFQSEQMKINFLLGTTFQNREYQGTNISGTNYTNDLLLYSIAAAGQIRSSNFYNQYRYTAVFGRLFLSWWNKYLINLTARRDGSSRFGPEERFANFGAIGGAWIFSSENFIKNNIHWLSFGKLRASYGISGNDQIGDYKFYDLWNSASVTYQGVTGLIPISAFNPVYGWESNRKLEFAGEFGFLKDRITISAAYYRHMSGNQLVNYNLPRHAGFPSIIQNLPALVRNSGIEFMISGQIIRKEQGSFTSSANLTIPKNKLLSFPGLAQSNYYLTYVEGESLNVIRRFKFLGVDPQTGIYTYEDVDGDGALTGSKDYQVLGNRDPVFYGGWQNIVSYKQVELNVFTQFAKQVGNNYLSSASSFYPGRAMNQPLIVLDHWVKEGDIAAFQKFTTTSSSPAAQAAGTRLGQSGAIYSDASFIRLKTISIAYKPKFQWLNLKQLQTRIFFSGQNLVTITNYKGSDPENQSYFQLPPLKTFNAGIQLTF